MAVVLHKQHQKHRESDINMNLPILSRTQQAILTLGSLLIVAFGQPASSWLLGLIAAACGYALFFRVLLCYSSKVHRFLLGAGWFTAVQLVQFSWFLSHPYLYIYAVYFLISLIIGLQFGILSIFIDATLIAKVRSFAALAGLWTIFEWSRLFLLSGLSWNPVGIALSGNIYSLQLASLWGVFGLSFWVIFVNLLALRAWFKKGSILPASLWVGAALIPYLYGMFHLSVHERDFANNNESLRTVLVQTAFPVEEDLGITDRNTMVNYVINEWRQILKITKKHSGKAIDLIVLPEFVVPYGTYSWVYPYEAVYNAFTTILGEGSVKALPLLESPLASTLQTSTGESVHLVNNAYWVQAIANYFQTGVLVGLEDAEEVAPGKIELYSSAIYFKPHENPAVATFTPLKRYDKRVLVPMGEYIPFAFCRTLAAAYGVYGSFTPGKQAKVFTTGQVPFGISICYEETFGNIVRENKQLGAAVLANLTNDAWYPNSTLPQQHFDHARLRTVECGIPLIRACNTGVTGAVDSLGRVVGLLGDDARQTEWVSDSMHIDVPLYTYSTLYSHVGDALILGISLLCVLCFLRFNR